MTAQLGPIGVVGQPPRQRRTAVSRHSVATTEPAFTYDVAIVGLGYVGLPTALEFHSAGLRVLGLDISPERVRAVSSLDVDLLPSDTDRLRHALPSDTFSLSTDPEQLSQASAVIVCVPTPVDQHLLPDLGMLRHACASVVRHVQPGQLVMLTSTTYVGCTEDFLVAPLTERGFQVGTDVFVAFSAERIDPGVAAVAQVDVPRVVGGATAACRQAAMRMLSNYANQVHPVRSLGTAEMTKLLENTFRAVNIAMINEFADMCRHLDVDVNEVIDAAATKPFGYMAFRPGPGVGGHCIPCDPHYLLWQLRKDRLEMPLVAAAMHDIATRPRQVVDRIRDLLANVQLSVAGSRVLVVGVSYKPNVADVRESPALEIIDLLRDHGASVEFVDSHVEEVRLGDGSYLTRTSDPSGYNPDLVLVHTAHANQNLSWLSEDQLLLDATYRAPLGSQGVTL